MSLELRDEETGLSIDISLRDELIYALQAQWVRSEESDHIDGFRIRLSRAVIDALQSNLDWDFQAPTPKQCGLAAVIARKLSVPVPTEAKCFRGSMAEFLAEFAPRLNSSKSKGNANLDDSLHSFEDNPF